MKRRLANLELTYQREVDFQEPESYRDLLRMNGGKAGIAQGGGLSYAAASFGEGSQTISMRKFDRVLSFSPDHATVEVEAGMTLRKLFDFLSARGFYLAIQPGWPDLCVGALIATNVHGKNPYVDGVFSNVTESFRLFHPDKGVLFCSRSENTELFELTCGGLGLTGIILSACIKLKPWCGNLVKRDLIRVGSLAETIEVLMEARDKFESVMSWTDLSNPRGKLGKGFIITGTFYGSRDASHTEYRALDPHKKGKPRLKVFNKVTMPWINRLYYHYETGKGFCDDIPLFSALFPFHNKGFYFDLYGKRGFITQQILIPEHVIFNFLKDFETALRKARVPIVLSAFKAFRGEQKLLCFNGNGFSLYADFINDRDSKVFLQKLDDMATQTGCICNVIRNSFLSAGVVKAQYRQYDAFRARLHAFDPNRRFRSELSDRLEL